MPLAGLEPARPWGQQILSLWCLPIPPQRQIERLQLGLPFLPTHTAFNWYPSVRSFVHPSLAWQGIQGSNLYRNSQSVMCYHYTNPLCVIWTKWKLQDTFWTIDLPVGRFAKYSQNRTRTYNTLFAKQNLLYVSLKRFIMTETLEQVTGLEPAILCLEGRCVSHYATPAYGVPPEIRTLDTRLKRAVLCLLS